MSLSLHAFVEFRNRCELCVCFRPDYHAGTPVGRLVNLCGGSTLYHSVEFQFHTYEKRDGHFPWRGEGERLSNLPKALK